MTVIRIAAAGDIHASEASRDRVTHAFAHVENEADVILLAGDLTTTGDPDQARVLADACQGLSIPVFAVLGNHDFHAARIEDVRAVLEEAGVHVLDRSWKTCTIAGLELGVVGTKGFVGGFPGSALPDFRHPDRVVLGGLNEGTWPPETRSDAWLSRPMRLELGLDLPERRIALSAHDFAQMLGAREVILTRAAKAGARAAPGR